MIRYTRIGILLLSLLLTGCEEDDLDWLLLPDSDGSGPPSSDSGYIPPYHPEPQPDWTKVPSERCTSSDRFGC